MYIRFVLKKSKQNQNEEAPIWCRITVAGERAEFSTSDFVSEKEWFAKAQTVRGNSARAQVINKKLSQTKADLDTVHLLLEKEKQVITAQKVKLRYLQIDAAAITWLSSFENFLKAMQAKHRAEEITEATVKAWQAKQNILTEFLTTKQHKNILLSDVKPYFAEDMKIWLLADKQRNHNYTVKVMSAFVAQLDWCLRREWLSVNPFASFEMKKQAEAEPKFLAPAELERIKALSFQNDFLERVRDLFLVQCYTGLAYVDLKNLCADNLRAGIDGRTWIYTKRQKSGHDAILPLLDIPRKLIEKYGGVEGLTQVVPINKDYNIRLKVVGAMAQIDTPLTTHLGRDTFAHLALNHWGVSIETVSRMLGHKNIKTTQRYYVRVRETRIADDMKNIF